MAGLGGSLGYAMGGIDWGALGGFNQIFLAAMKLIFAAQLSGTLFGGHVRFVFTIVLFIFILCVVTTITSFNEIPLDILANPFKVSPIQHIELESSVDCKTSEKVRQRWWRGGGEVRGHGPGQWEQPVPGSYQGDHLQSGGQ